MIRVKNLQVIFPGFRLKDINLSINKGEFFAIIGPTGAGKTVLLEALAGLVPIEGGQIFIGGIEVTDLPPEKRAIGIVYQDYALFPHLTVLKNIKYGLHFHKIDKDEAQDRLNWLLDRLNLRSLLKRSPVNLSGGELQRVSLARALTINPAVLLLDEPLSALDVSFKEEILSELKRLHYETDVTFLMVTHDFSEVLSLASRAAVMNQGRIEQTGEVEEIFRRPLSPFVADFVGMKNIFSVKFKENKAFLNDLELNLERNIESSRGHLAIRPEDIILSKEKLSSSIQNSFKGFVFRILNQGFYHEIHVKIEKTVFKALITKSALFELKLKEGDPVFLFFKSDAIHTF